MLFDTGAGFVFGAKGGGATEIAVKLILEIAEGEPDFKGEVDFKGLVLSFMSYATASIDKKETNADDTITISRIGTRRSSPTSKKTQEKLKEELIGKDLKEVWTIFEPKKLPFWEK